ncbi:MAG: hypothetical protein RL139_1074 [Gemmatimonadota bacterium]|jgi:hypothetical protein
MPAPLRSTRRRTLVRPLVLTLALAILVTRVASAARVRDLTGIWDFSVVTENGTGTPTVTFKQDGATLTGTYESSRMGVRPFRGTVTGDSLRFTLAPAAEGGVMLTFVGVIIGDDLVKGDVDFQGMGSATFTGARRKPAR